MTRCPICGRDAKRRAENAASPFCSPRCKSIDLGKWLSEDYRVATQQGPENEALRKEEN